MWMATCFLASTSPVRGDALTSSRWWQMKVREQSKLSQNRSYQGCLFGDSISSGLGKSFGEGTFNFAMGGLSSVSLLEQLKILKSYNIQCQQVIIAIGTNDAMNGTDDLTFLQNLNDTIALSRSMGATQITLVAAFYSTQEASRNPRLAGTNKRIEEINDLISKVANEKHLPYIQAELQPLFDRHTLRTELTYDGVHLNYKGRQIYRQVILNIFNPGSHARQMDRSDRAVRLLLLRLGFGQL
jgi:lysophospholipase L1-like esterase